MKRLKLRQNKLPKILKGPSVNQNLEINKLKKKWVLAIGVSFIGIAVIIAALLLIKPKQQAAISHTAARVIDSCAATNTITYRCYKSEIDHLTQTQSPEQAIALIKQQYPKISYVKNECHQLMHEAGRAALIKYNYSIAKTYSHGDQFCWSGYYHGAIEELANKEGLSFLVSNANSICADIPGKSTQSFYYYNCVHGMGHGFMFVENGALFKSLTDCDLLNTDFDRSSCYGGVFMQNIMNEQAPDEEEDAAGTPQQISLKANQPMYPCTAVAEKYKEQCYLMQTSYALQVENYDFSKVFSLCAGVEQNFQDTCYQSLGRDASGTTISNVDETRANCLVGSSQEARQYCVRGAAEDFVSYFHSDAQAKQLCRSLPQDLSGDCLATVKSYYSTF